MTTPPPDIVAAALRAAAHSPCRSKRGAAAFTHNGLIVAGFNHRPDGCTGSAKCKETCRTTAVHAEQDVILRSGPMRLHGAEMLHVKSVDGALVPSGGPSCPQCSKFILHANMAGVWLYHESGWRRYEAHEFHRLSLAALAAPVACVACAEGKHELCLGGQCECIHAPVAAEPPSLVAIVQEYQSAQAEVSQPEYEIGSYRRLKHAIAALLAWTPAQAEPAAPDDRRLMEDETWAGAVTYVRDMAKTIRNLTQRFVADGRISELATVRAEALEECADGMERAAKKARAALPASPPVAPEMPEIREGDEVTHVDVAVVVAVDNALIETSDGQGIALEDVTSVRRNGEVIWGRP